MKVYHVACGIAGESGKLIRGSLVNVIGGVLFQGETNHPAFSHITNTPSYSFREDGVEISGYCKIINAEKFLYCTHIYLTEISEMYKDYEIVG